MIAAFFNPLPPCPLCGFGRVKNLLLPEYFTVRTEYPELPAPPIRIKHQQRANRRVDDKVDFYR